MSSFDIHKFIPTIICSSSILELLEKTDFFLLEETLVRVRKNNDDLVYYFLKKYQNHLCTEYLGKYPSIGLELEKVRHDIISYFKNKDHLCIPWNSDSFNVLEKLSESEWKDFQKWLLEKYKMRAELLD